MHSTFVFSPVKSPVPYGSPLLKKSILKQNDNGQFETYLAHSTSHSVIYLNVGVIQQRYNYRGLMPMTLEEYYQTIDALEREDANLSTRTNIADKGRGNVKTAM
jgi:hypothetical protein